MFIIDIKEEGIVKEDKYKIGDTFAVPITSIGGVYIAGITHYEFEINKFQWYLSFLNAFHYTSDVMDAANKMNGDYTLLKYKGNNEFIEYYSGKTIRLFESEIQDVKAFVNEYSKIIAFDKEKDESKKLSPLVINEKDFEPITSDIETNILINTESSICKYFDRLEEEVLSSLKNRIHEILLSDWNWAEKEDKLKTFVKTK